jgi:hypothetical protein
MSYAIGLRAIRRLCEQQQALEWYKAKLTAELFKANEVEVYEWVHNYVKSYHVMPPLETLFGMFPDLKDIPTPDPAGYYVDKLECQYFYDQFNLANIETSKILKANPDDWGTAFGVIQRVINKVTIQRLRNRIMNFGAESFDLLRKEYLESQLSKETVSGFGWPYLDNMGGLVPGDVVSVIGRPGLGKTWCMLYLALFNWRKKKHNVLFVSMEMNHLSIAQRAATMIAGTNLTQLKQGAYSTQTAQKFFESIKVIKDESLEVNAPNLYIVNGNLAASVDDIYVLADQLECIDVFVDGASLCRHKNTKLDRFTRAAENCELMKRNSEDLGNSTFSSWHFNREAAKKQKQGKAEHGGLEDIAYSDAIPQISSVVLGLFQEEGVETVKKKKIRVMKGRGGEVGEFEIFWNMDAMCFDQVIDSSDATPKHVEEYQVDHI